MALHTDQTDNQNFALLTDDYAADLGELIVEFKELNNIVAAVSAALGLAIYGVVVWQTGWRPDGVFLLVGGVAAAVSVCCIMTLVPKVQDRFRYYTNGLEIIRHNGYEVITLDGLEGFTIGKTHVYQNGAYTGSTAKLAFDAEGRLKPLRYSMSFRRDTVKEQQLDAFCDLAVHAVATRMLSEIKSTGRTRWTGSAVITKTGLEITDRKGNIDEIPFAAICEYQTSNGVFQLRRGGQRVMKANVDAANFLPGLCLLQWLSEHVKAGQELSDEVTFGANASAQDEASATEAQSPVLDGYALLNTDNT